MIAVPLWLFLLLVLLIGVAFIGLTVLATWLPAVGVKSYSSGRLEMVRNGALAGACVLPLIILVTSQGGSPSTKPNALTSVMILCVCVCIGLVAGGVVGLLAAALKRDS